MTCWYAWFSMTTTTTCAGCGTLAAGAVLAAGEGGLALADDALEPADAPCGGAEDAQLARPRASSALAAATRGNGLMGLVLLVCTAAELAASLVGRDGRQVTGRFNPVPALVGSPAKVPGPGRSRSYGSAP